MHLSLDFTGSLALTDALTRAYLHRCGNIFVYDDEMDGVVWVIRQFAPAEQLLTVIGQQRGLSPYTSSA